MDDKRAMRRALELAARAEGRVSPRPPVGAVVVAGGRIVGEGSTEPSPGPHAERVALDMAGELARGATLYTTLEPCSHTGATPPCADAVVEAGIARIVAATMDPHHKVRGRGFRRLRDAGIEVRTGVERRKARALIEPFAHWLEHGRPFVTLKLAASLDGKVAAADGTTRWISGEASRAEVHELRARADAVLVGSGTVAADDPALTSRTGAAEVHQPLRVVADSSGRTPTSAQVFDGVSPLCIVATDGASGAIDGWRAAGADVVEVPSADGGVDLRRALTALGERGVCHVLCEGGPTLAAALLAEGLVDRLRLYVAPLVIGGDAPGLFTTGAKTLTDAHGMLIERVGRVGDDLRIDAVPRGAG